MLQKYIYCINRSLGCLRIGIKYKLNNIHCMFSCLSKMLLFWRNEYNFGIFWSKFEHTRQNSTFHDKPFYLSDCKNLQKFALNFANVAFNYLHLNELMMLFSKNCLHLTAKKCFLIFSILIFRLSNKAHDKACGNSREHAMINNRTAETNTQPSEVFGSVRKCGSWKFGIHVMTLWWHDLLFIIAYWTQLTLYNMARSYLVSTNNMYKCLNFIGWFKSLRNIQNAATQNMELSSCKEK